MLKYRYDPSRVRDSFRRKYCRELDLPSGKPSGFVLFPITEQEINDLVGDFDGAPPLDGERTTISEWMLWAGLRLKYGINYLNPTPKCLKYDVSNYDIETKPEWEEKIEELEIKMQNYIDREIEYFNEKFLDKINKSKKSSVKTMTCMEEDYKKYFKENLDIPNF